MKQILRHTSGWAVLMLGMTIGLAASQSGTSSLQSPTARARTDPGTTTMTGCIERADQIAPSVPPAPVGTTVDSQTYVLIKAAAPASATAPTSSGAVGTTGTSAPAGTTYRLDGDIAKISPHVGHRVEVMGAVIQQPTGTSIVAATPDPNEPGAVANPLASTVAPHFRVDSIRMLADICPR